MGIVFKRVFGWQEELESDKKNFIFEDIIRDKGIDGKHKFIRKLSFKGKLRKFLGIKK